MEALVSALMGARAGGGVQIAQAQHVSRGHGIQEVRRQEVRAFPAAAGGPVHSLGDGLSCSQDKLRADRKQAQGIHPETVRDMNAIDWQPTLHLAVKISFFRKTYFTVHTWATDGI
ncbi:hypothetical protein COCON_G00084790 [Conger conger]|uniref:Uncharacterized protein n=1 Tax=Conger conger TaxID=82655 RepID=A0A9Q1I2Z0_CONCO|nr:hypothetical protein COCON_G00084790 [Conger conger]